MSDKEIKDSLWYYYFDDEKTVSYLLGTGIYQPYKQLSLTRHRHLDQQHKKAAAKEKGEFLQWSSILPHLRVPAAPAPVKNLDRLLVSSSVTPEDVEMQDASLADKTQNKLSLNEGASRPSVGVSSAKPSLSALAAASKSNKLSLASFAKAKEASSIRANGSSGLSKLAAKSRSTSQASAPSSTAAAAVSDSNADQATAQPAQKLSKLQQRVLARNSGQGAKPEIPVKEEEEDMDMSDQFPESDLFASGAAPNWGDVAAQASPFAATLAPSQPSANGDIEDGLLGTIETSAAFAEPSPDDLVRQAKKPSLGQTKLGGTR